METRGEQREQSLESKGRLCIKAIQYLYIHVDEFVRSTRDSTVYLVLSKSLVKTNYKTVTSTFVVLAWGVAVSGKQLKQPPSLCAAA